MLSESLIHLVWDAWSKQIGVIDQMPEQTARQKATVCWQSTIRRVCCRDLEHPAATEQPSRKPHLRI